MYAETRSREFRSHPASALRRGFLPLATISLATLLSGCQFLDTPARLTDGPYLGAVAGASLEAFDLPSGLDSETGSVFGIRAGYRFLDQRAAVEFAYDELVAVDLELDLPRLDVGEVSGRTFMAQLKGYVNDAQIQGYGLVGLGMIEAEVKDTLGVGLEANDTEYAFKLGGGVEVHIGANWTFYAESSWTHPSHEFDDFEFFTVLGGVNYRF